VVNGGLRPFLKWWEKKSAYVARGERKDLPGQDELEKQEVEKKEVLSLGAGVRLNIAPTTKVRRVGEPGD